MPSSTPRQARAMAAAAHDPKIRKTLGIPKKVATDFNQADTGTSMLRWGAEGKNVAPKAAAKPAPPKQPAKPRMGRGI